MPLLNAQELAVFVDKILQGAGTPAAQSKLVSESLVEANLAGHDSHGVIRLKEYLNAIRVGTIMPSAQPKITSETSTTIKVDGGRGFGQVVAAWTTEQLLAKAAVHGMAAGGIFNCGHIGRLGSYVQHAADQGFVALAFVNGGGSEPRVAPFGGRRAALGTNPIGAAVPAALGSPIVIDFSTAAVASGKIRVAKDKGEMLPPGWVIDREGRPSCDPRDYYDGGALLPAAGHKGYGLAVLVEIIGGLLSGAGSPTLSGWGAATTNGVMIWVLDVRRFRPLEEFRTEVESLGKVLKSIPSSDLLNPVLMPGEPELKSAAERRTKGVLLPASTWKEILEAAKFMKVSDICPPFVVS